MDSRVHSEVWEMEFMHFISGIGSILVSITDVSGDGDAANDSYIKKAANGTSSKKGVVSQIITKGMPEEIDTDRKSVV